MTPQSKKTYDRARARAREAGLSSSTPSIQTLKSVFARLSDKLAPATVRLIWSVVRGDLLDRGIEPPTPRVLGLPKVGDNVPYWNVVPADAIGKFLAAARTPIWKLVCLAILRQGWRASELCSIKWSDIAGDVVTFTGKGGKHVRQKIDAEVLALAKRERGKGQLMFLPMNLTRFHIYRIVREVSKRAGIRVTPHGLRATFISRLIHERGIYEASKLARHSRVATTERYGRWEVLE